MTAIAEARAIAAEHVDWALAQGQTHMEIVRAVGLERRWLWPTREELVEGVTAIWLRRLVPKPQAGARGARRAA
jgi:hypothetical protein